MFVYLEVLALNEQLKIILLILQFDNAVMMSVQNLPKGICRVVQSLSI